jgi:phytoene dehydrogenase-like protein
MLLARYATYNGSDVRRAPATLNCIAHVELALGGYSVQGGMYEITRALLRAAEGIGVRIHMGSRVERLRVSDKRVLGAECTDSSMWSAPIVVANADAAHTLNDLLPDGAARVQPEPSMSGWTSILRAQRRQGAQARTAHAVLFPSEYLQEFTDIFDRDQPPAEPTVYLCAQEACHGRTGWAEQEPVFVMANAPAEPENAARPPEVWEALGRTVLERLDAAGLRASGDAIVWERTPTQLAAAFPGSRGSIYGAASNSPLSAFRRPANRVHSVKGLYLASGSAHPGGGVPLCLLSGQAAAEAALADRD